MKHSKKLLSLFLSVVLLLGLLPTSALAAGTEWKYSGNTYGTITWNDGDYITSWDTEENVYRGQVNLGKAGEETVVTVNGTVTACVNFLPNKDSNVIIQGGSNGGTIKFDNSNYKNGNEVVGAAGTALFANNMSGLSLTLKNITIEYVSMTGLPSALMYAPGKNSSITLDNVTFKSMPYQKLIGLSNLEPNSSVTLKNQVNFTGSSSSCLAHFQLGTQFNGLVLENFSTNSTIKLMAPETVLSAFQSDPAVLATGAKRGDEKLFEFKSYTYDKNSESYINPQNRGVYYAAGKLYVGTKAPTEGMITEWEVDLGTAPTGCTVTGGAMRQLVTKNNAMTNVTITPGEGKTFAGATISSDFASKLHDAGLRHEVVGGKLVIKGTPTKDVNLSGVTWPEPVSNTKRVTLGTELPTGVELATGAAYGGLTQNITSWAEFKPVVLKATDGYVFDSGVVNALNREFAEIELAAAWKDNGDIEIKYSGNGDFNTTQISKNIKEIISPVAVEATVTGGNTTTKYATLSAALNAANNAGSGTVEIKKNLSSAVSNATLAVGVTLKDTTGNTYKAVGNDGASIDVATSGSVTLKGGKLEVTPKNNTNASVTVNTGSGSTVVSGSDKFTVTAAKGNGSGSSADNAKATVTIANANGSVTTGTGLTFTAGRNGSTFPLDGSDLTGADSNPGDAITVGSSVTGNQTIKVGTKGEGESAEAVNVDIPRSSNSSDNKGAVTVTKGGANGAMATVTVAKKGDSFKVGNTTYTAGADNSTFTIDANGNVKLTSGGISLADGESTTGSASGKTIENPTSSGNDTVTVEKKTGCDEVTVPASGKVTIDGKDYINGGANALKLKVTSGGVSVISGTLTKTIRDGESTVGNTSGATITNPAGSGNDTLEVTSDGTKDRVTVPGGTDKSVTITKAGATTGETYFNNAANSDPLVIDVTADKGASLFSGSVALREGQGIGVYGNTITYTNSNNSGEALAVRIYEDDEGTVTNALINLKEGRSFTDKDGNTYTAKNGTAEFAVDKATGEICLISGSAEVTPAANKTPEVQVAKADNSFYSVSGSKPFTVSTDKGNGTGSSEENAKASVTISNKGDSVTSGGLTFTAGENGSTFPLDGSKLNNNGDKLTVASGTAAAVEVGTKAGSTDPITVTVPAEGASGNSGATTITKGQPTIVKIGADNDSFKVGAISYPYGGGAKMGEEYAIDANGNVAKITARLYDADGKEINAGGVYDMIGAAISNQTVEMVGPSGGDFQKTLRGGVTLKDTAGNAYKAVGNAGIAMESGTDDVQLKSGTLTVTPAADETASVAVAKHDNTSGADDFTTVSGEEPFTVTAAKGNGTGSDDANAKATVTIPTTGNTVTVGGSADTGMVFTAGAANSTFPLDGSKLSNVGDSVKFGASHTGAAQVDVGNGNFINISNNVAATVKKVSGGHTVTLDTAGKSFAYSYPVGEEGSGSVSYTAAVNNTTFFVGDDGKTALVSGAVKVSQTGSTDVRPDGWNSSVSVSVPAGGSDVTVSTVSGTPAKGKAEVASGKSVTIGDKTYTAAADDTAFTFDENGKVTLDSGKVELDKDESILGGISGVEIKNTSADEAKKVTVEKAAGKDIVTVPAGGKVTIGGKEYTNNADSGEMKLEIDAQGKVTLAGGKADFGKDTSLNLNGAEIKNTGNSALSMTENGASDTLDVKQNGSFTVGTGTVKDPSADMSFTINDDGTVSASLTNGQSVTINGVKYTGGEGGATLKLDQDGNLSISGSYSANIPGQSTHEISGRVTQDNNGVSGATVTLTQGGKEAVKLATVTTNPDGSYSFPAVPAGTYNVVVISGGKTMTKLVTVADGDVDMGELALPSAKVSSIVEVKPTSPVGAMVGGLDDVAETHKDSSNPTTTHVEVKLTVQGDTENADIAALAVNQTLTSLNFTVSKTVNSVPDSPITNTGTVLEIILTFDTSNKTNIVVYRKHGSESAAVLTKLDTRPTDPAQYEEGTYYVGSGFVVVYTSKFSPYAIGYEEVSHSGSSGGSGSSSGSGASVGKTQNGSVSVSPKNAKTGETVTVTVKPDAGYKLGTLTVTDKDGNKLALTKLSDTQYTYVAPNGQVEVKAEFVKLGTDYASCAKDSSCPIAAFTDAKPTAWYHDGMHYCLDNGLMNGFGNGMIGPDHPTTRAQVVVMLWRLNGSPVVNYALDFADVAENAWYTEAIRWAKSTGVADGYGNGCFGPDDTITREQMVTILYRYAQNKGYDVSVGESTNILSFADATSVSEFAFPAMQWACGSGMVNGMDGANGTVILLPQGDTIRAQMATMLMRFCVEIVK